MSKSEDIFNTLVSIIKEAIQEDWLLDFEFEEETQFGRDLELESIEFVVVAEKIQSHFGSDLAIVPWLMTMELDAVISLSIGDLVRFVEQCLEKRQPKTKEKSLETEA